jgi:hypothetical protein
MDVVRAMPPARRKRIANRVVRSTRPAIRDPWSSVWLRMPAWSLGLGVSPLIFEAGAVAPIARTRGPNSLACPGPPWLGGKEAQALAKLVSTGRERSPGRALGLGSACP